MKEWRWWKGPYTCQEAYQQVSHSHWRSNRNGVRKPKIPYLRVFFAFVRLLMSQLEWNQGKIHLTLKNVHFTFPLKLLWIHIWQDIRKFTDDITYDIFNMYCTTGLCFYKMALVIVKSWVRCLKWSDLSNLQNISHQDLYSN